MIVRVDMLETYQYSSTPARRISLVARWLIRYSLRLKACSSGQSAGRCRNSWRTCGSPALAVSPRDELSVGTLRQPMVSTPSSRRIFSRIWRALLRSGALGEVKIMPTPYSPGAGGFVQALEAFREKYPEETL